MFSKVDVFKIIVFNIDDFIYIQQLLDDTTKDNILTFVIYEISQIKKWIPCEFIGLF
jgi:hypothetical protein